MQYWCKILGLLDIWAENGLSPQMLWPELGMAIAAIQESNFDIAFDEIQRPISVWSRPSRSRTARGLPVQPPFDGQRSVEPVCDRLYRLLAAWFGPNAILTDTLLFKSLSK